MPVDKNVRHSDSNCSHLQKNISLTKLKLTLESRINIIQFVRVIVSFVLEFDIKQIYLGIGKKIKY